MPAFRSVVSMLWRVLGDFLYTLKAGQRAARRPLSAGGTAVTRAWERAERPLLDWHGIMGFHWTPRSMTCHAMASQLARVIMRTPRVYWWEIVVIGLALAGLVWVGFGVKVLLDSRHFLATAAAANGVVVDEFTVMEGYQDGAFPRSYPVVQFVTDRGEVVRFQAARDSRPPDFRVGGSIKVLYDSANPQHVRFDTWTNRYGSGIRSTAGGLMYIALLTTALGYLFVSSKRNPVVDRSHIRSGLPLSKR